uniref:Uncharacterized protein n=1 Tax=Acrobeloides nanus TaxID=290746 RepID=A0A914ERL3_9BILA
MDLRNDKETVRKLSLKAKSPVTTKQGQHCASGLGLVKYLECSALTQQGLADIMWESCPPPHYGFIAHPNPTSEYGYNQTTSEQQQPTAYETMFNLLRSHQFRIE